MKTPFASKRILFLFYCIGMGIPASAEVTIPIDTIVSDSCISIEVLQSDLYTYNARIRVHHLNDIMISYQEGTFHQLSFDDGSALQKVGEPSLPTIIQHLAMPTNSRASVSIDEYTWTDIFIGSVFPAQEPYYGKEEETLSLTRSIYTSPFYHTNLVEVSNKNVWNGSAI